MLDYNINHEHSAAMERAFAENERSVRIQNYRTACILATVFMPAGVTLDLMEYPGYWKEFLGLRLVCSALLLLIWWLVKTPFGQRHYQTLGLILPALPNFFISWMIYVTEGAKSPYYAGLFLVLLGAGLVLRWTLRDTIIVFLQTTILYTGACLLHQLYPPPLAVRSGEAFNNFYFLLVSGTFVMVGVYFYNRLRFKEFALRFELDLNRKELEVSNQALGAKKEELETSNVQLSQKTGELEKTLVELRQTQEQLVTKEKQASLGVWSAGIIHEMNNPLNFARTGLYAMRSKEKFLPPAEQPDFKDLVADIEDGINRVHTIVSDLRTYAHPGREEDIEEVRVADLVRVALRFFSGDLQGTVEVIQNIPAEQTVFVNRNKLIQVLGNLLQNAIDALKSKTFDQGHPVINITGRLENGRSLLVVRDNGPGIAQQHLDKIFDPFFTTKDVGQGMGLGLGICYRIVQQFGGTIRVRTEPGQFCEFMLDFPAEGVQEDGEQ